METCSGVTTVQQAQVAGNVAPATDLLPQAASAPWAAVQLPEVTLVHTSRGDAAEPASSATATVFVLFVALLLRAGV
jgi:hypothetical protein